MIDILLNNVSDLVNNKVIFITGGTGTFGYEITKVLLNNYNPKKLIIFSRDEFKQYNMKQVFPENKHSNIRYFIGDVRDRERLNMAMQDLFISEAEQKELSHWADELGVSESDVRSLHQGYLESFIQAALRDGVITRQEREMIDLVGKALRLPVVIPELPQLIQANEDNLSVGKRVCFTGEAFGLSGNTIQRADLESLAAKVGLHPVKGVTKKGCDILVAADEATMSGKAKKAKDWGIPVISVEKFVTYCTFGK